MLLYSGELVIRKTRSSKILNDAFTHVNKDSCVCGFIKNIDNGYAVVQTINGFLLNNNPLKIHLERLYTVSRVNKRLSGVDFSWALKDDHDLREKGSGRAWGQTFSVYYNF